MKNSLPVIRQSIHWTQLEWETLALALALEYPQADLLNATNVEQMGCFTLAKLNEIMDRVLAPGRQRKMNQLVTIRVSLAKVYADLRARAVKLPIEAAELATEPGIEAAEPTEPDQADQADQADQTAPPVVELAVAPEKRGYVKVSKNPKVFWKPEEYLVIAREILRLNPHGGHLQSTTMAPLTAADMNAGQLALPSHRRRPAFIFVKPLREPMLKAFYAISKEEIAPKRTEAPAASPDEFDDLDAIAQPPAPPAPAIPDHLSLAPVSTGLLLDALLSRLGAQIGAAVSASVQAGVIAALTSDAVRDVLVGRNAPRAPLSAGYVKHDPTPPSGDREHKPKVLIVGLTKTLHEQEIKGAFEDRFDLRFYHPDENEFILRSKAKAADRTIVLTDFTPHANVRLLDKERVDYIRQLGSIGRLKQFMSSFKVDQVQHH